MTTTSNLIEGWYANGQVWLTWTPPATVTPPADFPLTWYIFASDQAFTDTADATLIGRIFDVDGTPERMRIVSGNNHNFRIPDANGGTCEVTAEKRLFVHTIRQGGEGLKYYTVSHEPQRVVRPNELATVDGIYSDIEPPLPHFQHREILPVSGINYEAYYWYVWVDGDEDHTAGRPDFEIMANATRHGYPHLFVAYTNENHSFSEAAPAVVALHGGDGTPTIYRPGVNKSKSMGKEPETHITFAHDDRLNVLKGGPSDRGIADRTTGWFGYRSSYNAFDNQNPVLSTDVVINYTQRRVLFVNDFMVRTGRVDEQRIAICGYSMGSSGTLRLIQTHPEKWSTATLWCQGFRGPGESIGLSGPGSAYLPTNLNWPDGTTIHLRDLGNLTDAPTAPQEYPLIRVLCGQNDRNGAMHWDAWQYQKPGDKSVADRFFEMDLKPYGIHLYWDRRGHGFSEWNHHWCKDNNHTRRDDLTYTVNYRKDQSFPAFYNHQRYNPAKTPHLNDWGTWGGYHQWSPSGIVDQMDRWECTMWLLDNQPSNYAVDSSPHETLECDFSIRRAEHFRPAEGETIYWHMVEPGTGTVIPNTAGSRTVPSDLGIIIHRLEVARDPARRRLIISTSPL